MEVDVQCKCGQEVGFYVFYFSDRFCPQYLWSFVNIIIGMHSTHFLNGHITGWKTLSVNTPWQLNVGTYPMPIFIVPVGIWHSKEKLVQLCVFNREILFLCVAFPSHLLYLHSQTDMSIKFNNSNGGNMIDRDGRPAKFIWDKAMSGWKTRHVSVKNLCSNQCASS